MQELQVSTTAVQAISTFRVEVVSGEPLTGFRLVRLYFLQGHLSLSEVVRLSRELLADPVTESFTVRPAADPPDAPPGILHTLEVTLLPGVTDPAAENLLRAAHLLGISGLERAATGQRYLISEPLTPLELDALAGRFSNPVIQRCALDQPIAPPFVPYQQADATVETIVLRDADDARLRDLSAERRLALNLAEMQAIQAYFRQEGRDPTDAELETLAQTWSEHCVHKTFKALIEFTDGHTTQMIDGLLRTYIRAATEQLAKPFVRSAFVDNAGIIAFDDAWELAFKVETHNHPSALEPFGGANTGVGGVVRDILGVSARPIANTDVLCFGLPDTPEAELPAGTLHPQRVADGVIRGVEDYGNKMGIPTVNGAVLYHAGYTANPLVFCGCLGLLPRDAHMTGAQDGDWIVLIGGRTGRDGLRGATFSSMEMEATTGGVAGSAVQIGHPIHEKQVQEAVLRLRDARLYHAITDCGAGGLSSAVGEMAAGLGGRVRLETAPLKYPGLRPWEIWLSEAQERMVLAVRREDWAQLQEICAGQEVEAAHIGEFEATGRLRLTYEHHAVGDLSVDFLHDGLPQLRLKAVWKSPLQSNPRLDERGRQPQVARGEVGTAPAPAPNVPVGAHGGAPAAAAPTVPVGARHGVPLQFHPTQTLLALLAHPDIRSKESVVRRYDHEVQGGTAVKPLVGAVERGHSDAAVLVPLDTQRAGSGKGVALSAGICPRYGELDPYAMAWAAVDEAFRNLVAVGADPDQVALLDNFCWGSPYLPDRLGGLVRCAQGCHDAALAYGAPFISGKDSLNNEYNAVDGNRHAIPGTLLISAVGIVPDVAHTVTSDLKQPGDLLYLIGATRDEFGGSHFNLIHALSGGGVPQPVPDALNTHRALHQVIRAGLVRACHDCSEGGVAVALAEMCIGGRLGAGVALPKYFDLRLLFSESLCRFLVEVAPADAAAFEQALTGVPLQRFGLVTFDRRLSVYQDVSTYHWKLSDLESAWRGETPATPDFLPSPRLRGRGVGGEGDNPRQNPPISRRPPSIRIAPPRVLILHASGTNRDREAALACELAGGQPEIVHVNQLIGGQRSLLDYHMLVVPGGFSYGDDLGAGTLWALDLRQRFGGDVQRFVAEGRPVLGICNGFQALVKAELLPGDAERTVTLTANASARFECRWVYLQPNPASPCLFTEGLDEPIYCPVAHGEGRVALSDPSAAPSLWANGLVALTYVEADGSPAAYPANPNGSVDGIAGLCSRAGNVLGLMPHPEDHLFSWQHPRRARAMDGLRLFQNGVKYA